MTSTSLVFTVFLITFSGIVSMVFPVRAGGRKTQDPALQQTYDVLKNQVDECMHSLRNLRTTNTPVNRGGVRTKPTGEDSNLKLSKKIHRLQQRLNSCKIALSKGLTQAPTATLPETITLVTTQNSLYTTVETTQSTLYTTVETTQSPVYTL